MLVNMKQSKTRQAKQNTTVSNIQLMGCVYLYPFSHPNKFCFVCVCGVFFFFFGCTGSSLLCVLFSICDQCGLLSSCYTWASLVAKDGL